jgi:hypothetical protein
VSSQNIQDDHSLKPGDRQIIPGRPPVYATVAVLADPRPVKRGFYTDGGAGKGPRATPGAAVGRLFAAELESACNSLPVFDNDRH